MDQQTFCPCGMPLKNGKCTRKHLMACCKGIKVVKRGRFSGKSKSINAYNEYK